VLLGTFRFSQAYLRNREFPPAAFGLPGFVSIGVAMQLVKSETPASVRYVAKGDDNLIASESIEIKINKTTKLEAEVPEGKLWKIDVTLRIQEFDA